MVAFCGVIWCSFGFMISQKAIFFADFPAGDSENFEQKLMSFIAKSKRRKTYYTILYLEDPKKYIHRKYCFELTYSLL